jgi:hypothetical protein
MKFSHSHDADRRGRRSLQSIGETPANVRQPLCEKFNLSFASTFWGGGKRTATALQQHHLHLVGTGVLDGPQITVRKKQSISHPHDAEFYRFPPRGSSRGIKRSLYGANPSSLFTHSRSRKISRRATCSFRPCVILSGANTMLWCLHSRTRRKEGEAKPRDL